MGDRKRFEGISRWTFECTVEILEVHCSPRYEGNHWPIYGRVRRGDRIGRRVVIEKKSPTNLETKKKKEELRKKKKEKKKRQNEMEYEKRDMKHNNKRIKRKMRKYKGKELKKAMF